MLEYLFSFHTNFLKPFFHLSQKEQQNHKWERITVLKLIWYVENIFIRVQLLVTKELCLFLQGRLDVVPTQYITKSLPLWYNSHYVQQHPPIYTYVSQAVSFHRVFQLVLFTSLLSIMCDTCNGQITVINLIILSDKHKLWTQYASSPSFMHPLFFSVPGYQVPTPHSRDAQNPDARSPSN
jgi:hypothetical protein